MKPVSARQKKLSMRRCEKSQPRCPGSVRVSRTHQRGIPADEGVGINTFQQVSEFLRGLLAEVLAVIGGEPLLRLLGAGSLESTETVIATPGRAIQVFIA